MDIFGLSITRKARKPDSADSRQPVSDEADTDVIALIEELNKKINRIERKVYRDAIKGNHFQGDEADSEWLKTIR